MAKTGYQQLGELLSVGIMLPASIGIGYGIGYLLDRLFGTAQVFKIVFLLFGIAAGLINLLRTVSKTTHDEPPQ